MTGAIYKNKDANDKKLMWGVIDMSNNVTNKSQVNDGITKTTLVGMGMSLLAGLAASLVLTLVVLLIAAI